MSILRKTVFGRKKDTGGVATAGYSLYQINPSYNTFGTIRRLSDNATQVINFNNGFIDEASANTFRGGSDATLVQWDDQFGGNHLQSKVQSREPLIFDTNGLIKHNGKPAIRFLNDVMETEIKFNWTYKFSVISVLKAMSTGTKGIINADYLGGGAGRIAQILRGRYESIMVSGQTGFSQTLTQDPVDLALAEIIKKNNGETNNHILRINEFEGIRTSTSGSDSQYLQLGAIGSGYYGDFFMAELQLFMDNSEGSQGVSEAIKTRHNIVF